MSAQEEEGEESVYQRPYEASQLAVLEDVGAGVVVLLEDLRRWYNKPHTTGRGRASPAPKQATKDQRTPAVCVGGGRHWGHVYALRYFTSLSVSLSRARTRSRALYLRVCFTAWRSPPLLVISPATPTTISTIICACFLFEFDKGLGRQCLNT
jgi:hypothetical protein